MPFRIKDLMITVVPSAHQSVHTVHTVHTVFDGDCGATDCGTTDCAGTSCGATDCGTTSCNGTSCGATDCGTTSCNGTSCGATDCGTTDGAQCLASIHERTIFSEDPDELTTLRANLEHILAAVGLQEKELAHQRALRTSGRGDALPTSAAELGVLELRLREALAEVQAKRAATDGR